MANITLNEYQKKAMTTCLPESDNLFYMLANLCGEVGEFASKAGKHMRKGKLQSPPLSEMRTARSAILKSGISPMKSAS